MEHLKQIHSILQARYKTGKPTMSARLKSQAQKIVNETGADPDYVKPPSGVLFAKGGKISEARAIINNFGQWLRKKGLPVPDMVGTTYQQADDVDKIQIAFDDDRDKLDSLLADIREQYSELRDRSRRALAKLSQEVDFPSCEEFLGDFKFELQWSGVGTNIGGSVLNAVSVETAARIRANQQSTSDLIMEAQGQLVLEASNEMADVIDALLKGKRLRQERLDKLAAKADEINDNNWLNMPELTQLINTLRSLSVDTSEIPTVELRREHASKVEQAKSLAQSTLSALGV